MILSIRHEGLSRLFEDGDTRGVHPEHVERLQKILERLDTTFVEYDVDVADFRLHRLYGDGPHYWAVMVDDNWRVSFRLSKEGLWDVDYFVYPLNGRTVCL